MARRKTPLAPEPTSAHLERTSREYAQYLLDFRAIPCVTDALKSSQRIALHLIRTHAEHVKTSAFAGEMIKSELYVHGNVPAEEMLARLAAPYMNKDRKSTRLNSSH